MSSKKTATGDTIFASQLFTRQELVGRGAYGAVYKGIENATGQVVAIKVLNLDTGEEDVSDIQREIATLSQLKNCDSQNITRYHGSFLNGTNLWIVMDYAAGGSIRSLLQALTKIDEKCIAVIAREVLQALGYLHKHGIIHRDIKAANILLTDEGRVQLCDFGVAGQVTMNSLKRNSFVGTPYWMAPEVIEVGQAYDQKADIWSLGITIYEIATGNPPFADQDPMRAVTLIPKSRPARLEGDWSPAMKEFVALCLHEDPKQRPSAEDLLKTKWIKSTSKSPLTLLKDLVTKYEQQKQESAMNKEETSSDIDIDKELERFDMEGDPDAWRFDTTKTVPTMTPSRASSISRPSLDSKHEYANGTKSVISSMQDSGVDMQGRGEKQSEQAQHKQDSSGLIPSSASATSPTGKAKATGASTRSPKKQLPPTSQPTVISNESHPLLRLFMNYKSASEEDVSTPHSFHTSQGPHLVSAPMSLTIPNLEEITSARLASRSPIPTADSSSTLDHFHPSQHHQHNHPSSSGSRHPESARLPFGLNMSKSQRFDRRPSAPVLMGSTPGPDYPFHNHPMLNRGVVGNSPLSSPRALVPPPPSSLLANIQAKQGTQDSEGSAPLSTNKFSHSHEIILPSQHQAIHSHSMRPSSTPSSPAMPPVAVVGSSGSSAAGSSAGSLQPNAANTSKDMSRFNTPRRPSPTMPLTSMSQQQPQPQPQQQQPQGRSQSDLRSTLPPTIPHRKASLDFSQMERHSYLRPSLPMRPPSAAAVRSSTFHGMEPTPSMATTHSNESSSSLAGSYSGSLTGISSGIAALGMQPINISEEKLPPFGHSPAHLKMLNVLPETITTPTSGSHRGSITNSDKEGFSPASSVNSDPTFGQMQTHSLPSHGASSSSSSASSMSSASVANSSATNGSIAAAGSTPGSGVVLPRPGLRTVGSSENFTRRIRSASTLKRNEEQEMYSKSGFHPSRPPQTPGGFPGQQSQGFQQQQYSYNHESGLTDMSRYRRASSPRRRSISMTNLNGGLSVIMIPSKKGSVDDYAPNPLLLPPSPSTTRFIAPSSMNAAALSSSPLRPTLHSMASSSSLSSSFSSISGAMTSGQANGMRSGTGVHGQQQQHPSNASLPGHGSSSLLSSSIPAALSSSPISHPQVTNNNNNTNAKSVMNITSPSNHHGSERYLHNNSSTTTINSNANSIGIHLLSHNASTATLMSSSSQQNLNQHLGHQQHYYNQQQQQQHHNCGPYPHHYHTQQQQQQQQQQQKQQQQPQNVPMHMLLVTPDPRLLQMDSLRRHDDLVEELQVTMNDLSKWLEVFETGLKAIRST
ncbi:hypothetical protein BGZ51_000344 [Haplosporangium sp. Z 767]|nr:hypothetical protein BGZ51_000344 [Haplosporangium sp. Z 767]